MACLLYTSRCVRDSGVIECRKQIPSIINWLKKNWPGCENMFLLNSAEMLNVENTRTVRGLYTLTSKDITERQVTEDTIAISGCEISSDSSDVERTYFGIPYRCLIPQTNIKNFLVAGRSISIDSEVKPLPISTYMSIGEAAGTASAMSISSDAVSYTHLDVYKRQSLSLLSIRGRSPPRGTSALLLSPALRHHGAP